MDKKEEAFLEKGWLIVGVDGVGGEYHSLYHHHESVCYSDETPVNFFAEGVSDSREEDYFNDASDFAQTPSHYGNKRKDEEGYNRIDENLEVEAKVGHFLGDVFRFPKDEVEDKELEKERNVECADRVAHHTAVAQGFVELYALLKLWNGEHHDGVNVHQVDYNSHERQY